MQNRTVCIEMDLVLNNLQRLICHKIQPTNQLSSSRKASALSITNCLVTFNRLKIHRSNMLSHHLIYAFHDQSHTNSDFMNLIQDISYMG